MAFSTPTQLGVIRWDLWHNNNVTNTGLGPNQYHDRIPFFGKETGINSVSIAGSSQAIIDQEIAYAREAGISFFAFNWYFKWPNQAIDANDVYWYARERFKESTSPDKNYVRAAYILSIGSITTNDWNNANSTPLTQIGDDMLRADYHKVTINGIQRPLVFYHSGSGDSNDLITTTQRANLVTAYRRNNPTAPDPYIVNLVVTGGAYAALSTGPSRGQAMSQYVGLGDGSRLYSGISTSDIECWNRYKNAGCKTVPIVSMGFDRRPMIDNIVPWQVYNPDYTVGATNSELATHLQEAVTFVNSNETECEANTILMYAWNEHLEGGYLCPTIVPDGNYTDHTYAINREKLDVVKTIFNPSGITVTTTTTTNVSSTTTTNPVINIPQDSCDAEVVDTHTYSDLYLEDCNFTLSYSFITNSWVSAHDYFPDIAFRTRNNKLFSFKNKSLYLHNSNKRGLFYNNRIYSSYITPVLNEDSKHFLLNSLSWETDLYNIEDKRLLDKTWTKVSVHNSYQSTIEILLKPYDDICDNIGSNIKRVKNLWNINKFRDNIINANYNSFVELGCNIDALVQGVSNPDCSVQNKRFLDSFVIVKLEYDNLEDLELSFNQILFNITLNET